MKNYRSKKNKPFLSLLSKSQLVLLLIMLFIIISIPITVKIAGNQQKVKSSIASGVLWTADMEEGTMNDWYVNSGGGEYNNGQAVSGASKDYAHNGVYSAKMSITANGSDTGVRLFRWNESRQYGELYYSSWYYIPVAYTVTSSNWWNLMQWKSKGGTCDNCAGNDPVWIVGARTGASGNLYLDLTYWPIPGRVLFTQNSLPVPTGRWFKLEAYYRKSRGQTGQIIVWQDGIEVFNKNNVNTDIMNSTELHWSVNNYANTMDPSAVTIYTDDALISTIRFPETATITPIPWVSSTLAPGSGGDTAAPGVFITSPSNNAVFDRKSRIHIAASAAGSGGVSKVDFLVNNSLVCTDAFSPYECDWRLPNARGASYTVTAKAYDASAKSSSNTIVIFSH